MTLEFRLRYAWAVLRRFRITLAFLVLLFLVLPVVFIGVYPTGTGEPISYGRALHHIYFLLFGQPSLDYVDVWLIEAMNIIIPPLGIATVVDGGVRFGYLFFAKHKAEKEWIEVIAEAMKGHVVVCGAGRVGYRVTLQLLALKRPVMVIEAREDAHFVSTLRDMNVPVLIDDARNPLALKRLNLAQAEAIICATNDDLANLNVALDARKANPTLRIVLRLFDEDLVERVRENFRAEAHSTSALAAPAFALTALDPRILHSFNVGPHLMVVSKFDANVKLEGMSIGDLRDRFGGLTLGLKRAGAEEQLHPPGETKIAKADCLTVQCRYDEYRTLREFTGEQAPPLSAQHH
ncbi:MAG: NAD-binding protein [Myxococcaceae bacterium]|nr:NAD-binding protein [Myxococcaceae bacterium]